jgi:hypothetical protein
MKLTKGQLRWLAMLFMVLDHFAEMILKPGLEGRGDILTKLSLSKPLAEILCSVFLSLGTFTGTVMIYFLIEGYFYTKNLRRYMLRLLLFGVISQIPFYMAFRIPALNMLFTLTACLGVIYVHYQVKDSGKKKLMLLGLFAVNCFSDWTLMAVPITMFLLEAFESIETKPGFKVHTDRLKAAWIKSFVLMLGIHIISLKSLLKGASVTCGFILAAILLTWFYDGNNIVSVSTTHYNTISFFKKYLFYIFYPLHLIILLNVYRMLVF